MPTGTYTVTMLFNLTACPDDSGRRLDRILRKALSELPLSAIHRLLRKGAVLVDGEATAADYRVQAGQTITIDMPHHLPPGGREGKPPPHIQGLPALEILYEGDGLLAVNKAVGLPVHGQHSGQSGCSLEEQVRLYLTPRLSPSLSFKPGPLHRLDRPSSGLIVFSTSINGARVFSAMMREGKIKKQYLTIIKGVIKKAENWQDTLVRDEHQKKTLKAPAGKMALTRVFPLMENGNFSLILAEIKTGRTHQIRAQAANRQHPLLGDKKYGGPACPGGFFLHAWRLEFPHPSGASPDNDSPDGRTSETCLLEAPLPEQFKKIISELFGRPFTPTGILLHDALNYT